MQSLGARLVILNEQFQQGRIMASEPIDLEQARTRLKDLVERARRGEEVILSEGGAPVAKLTPLPGRVAARRFGSAKGLIHMRENFDEPLDDFRPYM